MSILTLINPATAEGKAKTLLAAVQKAMGATPNIFTAFANAPAALEGYLNLNGALSNGVLNAQLREKLALVTAGTNGCDYCASAHTFLGEQAGIEQNELVLNLSGVSTDTKTQNALTFARLLIQKRGHVSKQDIQAVRSAGFSDEEIVEILAHVALNTFTNYFNAAFDIDIDFPEVNTDKALRAA
ncbi:MAG: carboxymuconolactone decarboxylase family protein [Gammaproteobacteria bacterium]|nr:MAG: carboxymuconolactone decarboxylase family protein [Gammaproteobacteria bacterium]